MPRTKYAERQKKKEKEWDQFKILIFGTMKTQRIEISDLASKTGVLKTAAMYKRFNEPQKFRQSELSAIAKALSIPWEELRDKIPG